MSKFFTKGESPLKQLRESLRLTQYEFAQRLGVRETAVSRWERGVSEPRFNLSQVAILATMLLQAGGDIRDLASIHGTEHQTKQA